MPDDPKPMYARTQWVHAVRRWFDGEIGPDGEQMVLPGMPEPPKIAAMRAWFLIVADYANPEGFVIAPGASIQRRWLVGPSQAKRQWKFMKDAGLITDLGAAHRGRVQRRELMVPKWAEERGPRPAPPPDERGPLETPQSGERGPLETQRGPLETPREVVRSELTTEVGAAALADASDGAAAPGTDPPDWRTLEPAPPPPARPSPPPATPEQIAASIAKIRPGRRPKKPLTRTEQIYAAEPWRLFLPDVCPHSPGRRPNVCLDCRDQARDTWNEIETA